jgi:hypothetical protein
MVIIVQDFLPSRCHTKVRQHKRARDIGFKLCNATLLISVIYLFMETLWSDQYNDQFE